MLLLWGKLEVLESGIVVSGRCWIRCRGAGFDYGCRFSREEAEYHDGGQR